MTENNFDEKSATKLCRSKETSAEELKVLAGHSVKVDRLIANHPNADDTVLSGLSGSLDFKTFEILLRNPKTPFETIMAIASSLISGNTLNKDHERKEASILAELDRVLRKYQYTSYGNKITVDSPDVLPPGIQRTYRLPPYITTSDICKLLQDFFKNPDHEQATIRLAKNKKTPAGTLGLLCGHYISVDRLIAKHPNADENILEQLAGNKSKSIRRNVFLNPNTDIATRARLVPEFSQDFLLIPKIDSIFGETPYSVYGIGQKFLSKILRDTLCPASLLNWACDYGGSFEQLSVWLNPATPLEILTRLLDTGYAQEANVLLAHPEKMLEFTKDLGYVGSTPDNYNTKEYGRFLLTQDETIHIVRRNRWVEELSEKFNGLWNKLVPKSGPAKTLQGEVLREISNLEGAYDHMGFSNGEQFYYPLRFIATHLADKTTFSTNTVNVILSDIRAMNTSAYKFVYELSVVDDKPEYQKSILLNSVCDMEQVFERLRAVSAVWCERHPEPIALDSL
ncbi:MAG TPA: hypothetical protein VMW07_06675 [Gallionella sp.]|nr:hypothetical protein [Gallionella sp.]